MPSLKPIRFRGVRPIGLVVDVRPNPSWDQRSVTMPRPMRVRFRIAWNATCGSSAQACTATSPSERVRVEHVAVELRQVDERLGTFPVEPEARLPVAREQRRPEPEGHGEVGRREPDRLARVVGRRDQVVVVAPDGPADAHALRRARPLADEVDELGAVLGLHVERREHQPVLHDGRDAGLVRPVEGDDLGLIAERAERARGRGDRLGAERRRGTDGARRTGRTEEPTPADRRTVDPRRALIAHRPCADTTFLATCERGSASASIDSDSFLVSSLVSWS